MFFRFVFIFFLAASILFSPVASEAGPGPVYRIPPELQRDERFVFAVMGDSRASVPVEQPEVFRRMIEELNILSPEFVFDVGDLIMGYTKDEELIRREWKVFLETVAAFEIPFIPVVGNHDVWDELSESIYRELVCDDLYFAFWHKGSRFIVLDTDKAGESSEIGAGQLAWLSNELGTNAEAADHLFIFMHKPLWGYNPKYTNWQDEVHPLLVKHGVSFVFCGHWHCYTFEERDGVNYIVTGGGGAELDGDREQSGGFHHYILVTVNEREVSWAVLEPGSVLPPDYILYDISSRYYKLSREVHGFPFVDTPLSKKMNALLPVANTFEDSLVLTVAVAVDPAEQEETPWSVSISPARLELPPGGTGQVKIDIEYRGKDKFEPAVSPPLLELVHDFSSLDRLVTVERDIIVTPILRLKKIRKTPVVDGDLSECGKLRATMPFDESKVASGGGDSTEKRRADVTLAWSENGLYMAASIDDDIHETGTASLPGDCLSVFFSFGADPRKSGEEDEIFIGWRFFDTGEGGGSAPVSWLERNMKGAGDVSCFVVHEDGVTRYEAEFPFSSLMLEDGQIRKGFTFFGDVVITDVDEDREPVVSGWTEALTTKSNTAYFAEMTLK